MSETNDRQPAPGQATTSRVKAIFSTIAGSYDRFNHLSSFGMDHLWRRAAVRMAALTRSSEVLDVAAGTGDMTLALARLGQPASVLSTDFVPEMLDVARRKALSYEGPTAIEFAIADAQALPFEDASFDVATVAFGVRNLPDRAANFREIVRVLRPGGRYVVLEFSRPPFAPFRALYHFYLRVVIPLLGGLMTGQRSSFVYLNESIRAFPTQEALSAELLEAGFTSVQYRNLTMGIVAVHVAAL